MPKPVLTVLPGGKSDTPIVVKDEKPESASEQLTPEQQQKLTRDMGEDTTW